MAQLALYRSWRPQTFDDVVGQDQVVDALKHSVATGDFAHAFLFCGSRGTGKTSVAKILAKAINCLDPQDGNPCRECEICREAESGALLDVTEIDAASNNSVDNIRRLTDEIHFMPTKAKYKVYIIDEVHMLSTGAFNALLKTLEEPPEHAVFILATTEAHRIPATITSRCQRFDFRRISVPVIEQRLRKISDAEGIQITDDALRTIARLADGGLRDAISLLDQVQAGTTTEIDTATVLDLAGRVDREFMYRFALDFLNLNLEGLILKSNEIQRSGRDLQSFVGTLAAYVRDILLARIDREGQLLEDYTEEDQARLKELAQQGNPALFMLIVRDLSKLSNDLRLATNKKAVLDLGLITLLAKLAEFEENTHELPKLFTRQVVTVPAEAVAQTTVAAKPEPAEEKIEPAPKPEPEIEKIPEPEPEIEEAPEPEPEIEEAPEPEPEIVEEPEPESEPEEDEEEVPDFEDFAELLDDDSQVEEDNEASVELDAEEQAELAADLEKEIIRDEAPPFEEPLPEAPPEREIAFVPEMDDEPEEEPDEAVAAAATVAEAPAKAAETASEGHVATVENPEETWQEAMRVLQRIPRVDLKMLLAPAKVRFAEGKWQISYTNDQAAIYKAVSKTENQHQILHALEEAMQQKTELTMNLEGDTEFEDNLNPDEPLWVQKLRQIARDNDLNVVDDR